MNMSFALTKPQILAQTKNVTRRMGWLKLKVGQIIQPVYKCQGLKKGEKVERLGCPIRVVSVRREPLNAITDEEVVREGFPDMNTMRFMRFFLDTHKIKSCTDLITRIEFEYLDPIEKVSA